MSDKELMRLDLIKMATKFVTPLPGGVNIAEMYINEVRKLENYITTGNAGWYITEQTLNFMSNHPKLPWDVYFDIKRTMVKNNYVYNSVDYDNFYKSYGITAQQVKDIAYNIL